MTTPFNFEQIIADSVSLQGRPYEQSACPDQYVGPVSLVLKQPKFPARLPADQRPIGPALILILESPHVDEYIDEPGPAKGFTGEMIRQHLSSAIDLTGRLSFGVVLMNAIQYQCSLGSNTAVYRDRVFRAAWVQGGKEEFQARLLATVEPGDLVMNCCTKGNDFEIHTPLRSLVENAIREVMPEIETIKRMHPASWRDPTWRGKAWRHLPEAIPDTI
jgi:hypothetical protein